jgi:hypothetical protein
MTTMTATMRVESSTLYTLALLYKSYDTCMPTEVRYACIIIAV